MEYLEKLKRRWMRNKMIERKLQINTICYARSNVPNSDFLILIFRLSGWFFVFEATDDRNGCRVNASNAHLTYKINLGSLYITFYDFKNIQAPRSSRKRSSEMDKCKLIARVDCVGVIAIHAQVEGARASDNLKLRYIVCFVLKGSVAECCFLIGSKSAKMEKFSKSNIPW